MATKITRMASPEAKDPNMQWLLDSDPSIRWQVMRDLTVSRLRSWPPSGRGLPRKGGAPCSSASSGRTVIGVMTSPHRTGGPTCTPCCSCGTWGLTPRASVRGKQWRWSVTGLHWGPEFGNSPFFEGEVEPCINGGVLALGSYFGETSDRLVDRLLGEQLADGGWNCEAERGSVRSSFHTTICVLEGLLEYEKAKGATAAVTDARDRAQEYLLERRMFRRLSSGEVIEPKWTRFTFPTTWHYDVLRSLDYLRSAGVKPDERVAEAVRLVAERRQPDGRWLLDEPHRDAVCDDLEGGACQPSRWNTLRALRVLDWYSAQD